MTEEDAFLIDVLARPDDEAPRLIYADWLEDHDDARAELVRLGWLARHESPKAPVRQEYEQELARARQEHGWVEYDGLALTWDHLVSVFRFRLGEAAAFCARRDLPLRTWDLDPRTLAGRFTAEGWPRSRDIDWSAMALQLALARRRLLERAGRAPSRLAGSLLGGRLVLYDPRETLSAGLSHRFSDDYFDADDMPPWDTWVMHVPETSPLFNDSYLLAWVPREHLERARAGIEVNEEGCLMWGDQAGTPFVRRLRAAGLFGG
jgi:uncharacterized protein (TIGR02996 family)